MNLDKKKILIISASALEYDGRLRELIEAFRLLGDVETITCGSKEFASGKNKIFGNNTKWRYLKFIKFVVNNVKKNAGYDIILADNRKSLIPAFLCKKYTKFLIHDSRELYVFSDVKKISSKVGCVIEKCLMKKLDLIISANEERAEIMVDIYKLKKRPFAFENIRNFEDFKVDETCMNIWEEKFSKYKYNFISTAGCSLSRKTDLFVNAIGGLDNTALYLIGSLEDRDKLEIEELIKNKKIDNVFIIHRVKAEQLNYFLAKGQIGIVAYHQKDLNNKFCASGKIYEYICSNMPVLCTSNPPLKRFCEKHLVGIATDNILEGAIDLITDYEKYLKNVGIFKKSVSVKKHREVLSEYILKEYNEKRKRI